MDETSAGDHESGRDRIVQPTVVRTYLELADATALRGEPWTSPVRLAFRPRCTASEYRALYAAVGETYAWRDRDAWTDDRLQAHLDQPGVAVWVAEEPTDGAPAGYFELARRDDGAVEIAYFGLCPAWHGRRLGAQLLTAAVGEAWAMGASRVTLNTCTLDAPAALPNYLARGFTIVRTERLPPTP